MTDKQKRTPWKREGQTVYATQPVSENSEKTEDIDGAAYRDKEWLYYQYKVLKRSQPKIADECGVAQGTISNWLKKFDIETRNPSEHVPMSQGHENLQNESWLREKYVENGKTGTEIAKEVGCNKKTVYRWLRRHDIEPRDSEEAHKPDGDYTDADWLFDQLHVKGKTIQQVADEQDVSRTTIRKWMDKNDVPSKSMCEANHDKWARYKKRQYSEKNEKELIESGAMDLSYRDLADRPYKGKNVWYRDEDWLKSMVGAGYTYKEIADIAGCSESTIQKYTTKYSISRGVSGSDNYLANFSEDDVITIRERYADEDISLTDLAKEYGGSPSAVSMIVNGKTWGHVSGPIKGEDY